MVPDAVRARSSSWRRTRPPAGVDGLTPRAAARRSSATASATRDLAHPGRRRRRQRRRARGAAAAASRPAYKRIDTCAAEFESFTPYLYSTLRRGVRGGADAEAEGRDPRQRARTASARASSSTTAAVTPRSRCARRLRDGDGQLQPGDGLDRLRHGRPAVLRAADVRGRDRDHRARAQRRRRGRVRRAVRRPDAAQAGAARCRRPASRSSARRPTRSTSPKIASGSRSCCDELRHSAAGERHGDVARRGAARWRARSAIRWSCGRRTCSAAARWRSSTTRRRSSATWRNAVDASPERPILIDHFLEDAFELDVDALADAQGDVVIGGIMEHIEEAGIHSGDSSCVVPPYLVAETHLADHPRLHAPHRARAQGRSA